jgi:hypothetical protein
LRRVCLHPIGGWRVGRIHGRSHRKTPSRHGNAQRSRNPHRLNGIELPHTPRHEEALEKSKNRWNPRPEEEAVKNPQAISPQIEVMDAETAQKQRQ